jgi:hypothetical protein
MVETPIFCKPGKVHRDGDDEHDIRWKTIGVSPPPVVKRRGRRAVVVNLLGVNARCSSSR